MEKLIPFEVLGEEVGKGNHLAFWRIPVWLENLNSSQCRWIFWHTAVRTLSHFITHWRFYDN